MVYFACVHCQQKLHTREELRGRKIRCPKCRQPCPVPKALLPTLADPGRAATQHSAATLSHQEQNTPPSPSLDNSVAATLDRQAAPAGSVNDVTQSPDEATYISPTYGRIKVPGYQILGELGRGGMGVVYKAVQIKLHRPVALKMILAGDHAATADLTRFQAEAEAIAQLQHANIVQVFEVGEYEGRPFFSLEFCGGGSLKDKLNGTPLPAPQAAALVETLARAIHAAHTHHIIHRDLKPANVLMTADGTPKITDFGLAKNLDEAGQTQSGAIMGTPSYMAPEQASGVKSHLSPAADVYALGAILYECLTGRPPFRAANALDTLYQVIHEEPVAPSRLQSRTPRDLETICLKCLRKEPDKRYASAASLAEDLRRYQAGEPILARPLGRIARSARWCRRHPAEAVAGLLCLALLTALIVVPMLWAAIEGQHALHLSQEHSKTQAALELSEKNRHLAEDRLQDVRRQSAASTLERALLLCEQGDVAHGLLSLNQGLQTARLAGADDLEQDFRWNLGTWSREINQSLLILPHPDAVRAVAFAPDGQSFATGCQDGKVRFWETATGREIGLPLDHPDAVRALAFHPNGRWLVTGCEDGKARVWSVEDRLATVTVLEHRKAVSSVAYSPDGERIATGSFDGTAQLWSAETGKPIGPPIRHVAEAPIWSYGVQVAFSPDGATALSGIDHQTVQWNAKTGAPIGQPVNRNGYIISLAIAPSGKKVATATLQQLGVQQWASPGSFPVGALLSHRQSINALAYSADANLLVGGSLDNQAVVWDAQTGQPVGGPLRHRGGVTSISVSPDGRTILTGSSDGTARLWKVRQGALLHTLTSPLPGGWMRSAAFSPDSKMVATGSTACRIDLWDVATGKAKGAMTPTRVRADSWVMGLAFMPDGKTLWAAECQKQVLSQWDVGTGTVLKETPHHGDEIWRLALSSDGKTLLSGMAEYKDAPLGKNARLWDTATGQPLGDPLQHAGTTTGIAFRPDNKVVVTGSRDRTTRLWDATTGKPLGPPVTHSTEILATAFSPDSRTIVTGGADGNVQRWDADSWKPLGIPMEHRGSIECVAYSPDGKIILTSSLDKTGRLWNARTGKPIGPPLQHAARIWAIVCSPDNKCAVTASDDGTAKLWSMPVAATGDVEELNKWVRRITGQEMDENGTVRVLSNSLDKSPSPKE